jgi:hypothetical protein
LYQSYEKAQNEQKTQKFTKIFPCSPAAANHCKKPQNHYQLKVSYSMNENSEKSKGN